MSVGIGAAGPFHLPGLSSSDLSGAVLDPPSVDASRVVGIPDVAGPFVRALPGLVSLPSIGLETPASDLAWLDRIHVLPREVDLGSVLSDVEVPVEVWNGFLRRARSLVAINLTGPAGVEVVNPYGLPTHFPGSESKAYIIRVLAEGGARVDNLVRWVFLSVDSNGTTLHLLGLRMLPFSLMPDLNDPVSQGYGYLGDVITSDDGSEQRRLLREIPHGWLEFTVTGIGAADPRLVSALLHGWTHRPFGVPVWPWWNRLRTAIVPGATEIDVDVTDVPWSVGMLAFLWRDADTWDVARVDAILAGGLRVTLPITGAWPATSTLVLPMVTGFLAPEQTFTWLSLRAGRARVRFTIPAWRT